MQTVRIKGYLKGGECSHCGRELKHVICTSAGDYGAACFANKLTAPKTFMGKPYRNKPESIISLAKQARDPARNGIGDWHLTFTFNQQEA